jgi:hypothetical protein
MHWQKQRALPQALLLLLLLEGLSVGLAAAAVGQQQQCVMLCLLGLQGV